MDNNWKTATKADRAALYHVARAIADTTDLSVEAIMEQAFGHKLMVGTDYLSNFRSGAIGRPKAKLIHAWIAERHTEAAHAVDPRLFPTQHTNAWDNYIEERGIRGQLQIKRFTKNELNLVKKVKDRDAPDAVLKLGEEFCFLLRSNTHAHTIGFHDTINKFQNVFFSSVGTSLLLPLIGTGLVRLHAQPALKGEKTNETVHLSKSDRQDHHRSGARQVDMAQALVRWKHARADHQAAAP